MKASDNKPGHLVTFVFQLHLRPRNVVPHVLQLVPEFGQFLQLRCVLMVTACTKAAFNFHVFASQSELLARRFQVHAPLRRIEIDSRECENYSIKMFHRSDPSHDESTLAVCAIYGKRRPAQILKSRGGIGKHVGQTL